VSDPSLKIDESGRELPFGTIGARKELKCYVPVTRLTQSTAQLDKLFRCQKVRVGLIEKGPNDQMKAESSKYYQGEETLK
jgi:hypothetical protein